MLLDLQLKIIFNTPILIEVSNWDFKGRRCPPYALDTVQEKP